MMSLTLIDFVFVRHLSMQHCGCGLSISIIENVPISLLFTNWNRR